MGAQKLVQHSVLDCCPWWWSLAPFYLTDSLDLACISPAALSHANTIPSLLLSSDHPKSHASKENCFWPRHKPFPGSKVYHILRLLFRNSWCIAWNICTSSLSKLQSSWFSKGECGRYRSKEVSVYQMYSFIDLTNIWETYSMLGHEPNRWR